MSNIFFKVDDINEWLEPPQPLKRTSPDYQLNNILSEHPKTRKVEESVDFLDGNLPSFLRNQSVEGLESKFKHDVDAPLPFCRHYSIPDNCENADDSNSESSDDDLTDISDWYRNIPYKKVDDTKNILAGIVKKGESILAKKASYDVTDAPRNTDCPKSRVEDVKNNDKNSTKQETNVRNIPKTLDVQKPVEKPNFFAKKLLSPKLSRLFKNNSGEVVRNKNSASEVKEEKSRSNFFVQKPSSPGIVRSSYRVRPAEEERKNSVNDVIKSDLKLASLGKPMTPIFRRHLATEKPDFVDCRYSCRDRKKNNKNEEKFVEIGRNRIKTPVSTDKNLTLINGHVNNLLSVQEKQVSEKVNTEKEVPKKRELGISRSNYVSLANLKINSKQELGQIAKEKAKNSLNGSPPVEKVI